MRNKSEWLMRFAVLASEMSTCARIKVGAVIVKNNRVISFGYNGSAPGRKHCIDRLWVDFHDHHEWALRNEIHAEMNAILFAAKEGIAINGSDMYVTHFPCTSCAKYIVQVGIKRLFYLKDYIDTDPEILYENGVEVKQL